VPGAPQPLAVTQLGARTIEGARQQVVEGEGGFEALLELLRAGEQGSAASGGSKASRCR
jgi:hypothetical protein